MNSSEQTLANILRSGARAFGGFAAARAEENESRGAKDFSGPHFDGWHDLLAARLEDLSAAVSTEQPKLFVQQVLWTSAALKARGVRPEALRRRLEALRQVLVGQLPGDLVSAATTPIDLALEAFGEEPVGLTPRLMAETAEEQLAARYLVAILEGDRRKASGLILEALATGQSLGQLYIRILQPAQEELGRMWVLGEINVAEEHFATATTRHVMAQLHAREICHPANGKTVVAAGVAGNQHDLGIQMVADLLESSGWRAIQLGANVPAEDLAEAVEFYAADLVALTFSMPSQLLALKDAIAALRQSDRGSNIKIIVGGCKLPGIADIVTAFGADGYAEDAAKAVAMANDLAGEHHASYP